MLQKQILEHPPAGVGTEEVEAHLSLLPEHYFINTTTDEVERHLTMIHQLLTQIQTAESVGTLAPIINWRDAPELGMTVVNVVTWDRAGLFYKLAGALTLAGVNIISTKAISRTDHITIDTFYITSSTGGIVTNEAAESIFRTEIAHALIHGKPLNAAINRMETRARAADSQSHTQPNGPSNVDFYHGLSNKRTIIEIQTKDRVGLLYDLARLIYRNGFDIAFARIATEQGLAIDTFYIENIDTRKPIETENLLELREKITAALQV